MYKIIFASIATLSLLGVYGKSTSGAPKGCNLITLSACEVNSSVLGVRYVADRDVDGDLYILDASNASKFSRHVILNLHRIVIFRNQHDVKR